MKVNPTTEGAPQRELTFSCQYLSVLPANSHAAEPKNVLTGAGPVKAGMQTQRTPRPGAPPPHRGGQFRVVTSTMPCPGRSA
jgi:hypothetical protein